MISAVAYELVGTRAYLMPSREVSISRRRFLVGDDTEEMIGRVYELRMVTGAVICVVVYRHTSGMPAIMKVSREVAVRLSREPLLDVMTVPMSPEEAFTILELMV